MDKYNLKQVILDVPKQFAVGFSLAKNIIPASHFDFQRIVLSGMGGSALPGDILQIYKNLLTKEGKNVTLEIYQNRFYKLPPESYQNCLNIVCSYSGNTEETISSLEEAIQNNLPTIAISSGGKMEEICKKQHIPHIKLPHPSPGFQPRMALGYFVAVILSILIEQNKFPDTRPEIQQSINDLTNFIANTEEMGKTLAGNLVEQTLIIYSSVYLYTLALIWKIKFNENSKVPAFWNTFPELNHNEFSGFANPQSDYTIIMLRDLQDDPRNLKRYTLTKQFLEQRNIASFIIDIPEGEAMFRIFATLALGDWTAYYLAMHYGIDPTVADMVEDFKKQL